MTTTRPAPTTTYPFAVTTFKNPSPSTRSSYPTTYTDTTWLPPISADTWCTSATAYPSVQGPQGLKAACVISNAADINPNAFWDVYECCPGHDMSSYGYAVRGGELGNPGICMMQCSIGNDDGTTWQQVGECLQKRVKEVVCMPKFEERSRSDTDIGTKKSTEAGITVTATRPGEESDVTQSATTTGSTGAAASHGIMHASTSKVGAFAFFLLAVGSAAGMAL